MTDSCFYHPDRQAAATCVQCAQPICEPCRETVAGQTVCQHCVGEMRAKVEREMDTSPPPGMVQPGRGLPIAGAGNTWPPPPTGGFISPPAMQTTAPGVGRILAGIGLSVVLGLVGTAIWVAVTFYGHFELSLVAVGVGWLCGFGALKGCGQGGKIAAIIGAVAALGTTLIGASIIGGGKPGLFEWFCVAFGAYEGYIVPMRGLRRRLPR